ncbi:tyrosine-protein kinase family protein [uncultured Nonlabens sp.]|uniref:GumC family protein n=1 Tax=uncultured Nonlabens sp. TaxID=859306 RepID=UPI002624FD7E|nr:tyrosine-protein kinase family protein [uncultured Nonlabens sp.]
MSTTNVESNQALSLKDQINQYLRYWPWFIISVFIFLLLGFVYLRYANKEYVASTKILIKDTQNGGGLSELSALGDIDVLGGSFNTVENEIEILNSNRLINDVVSNLDLNIVYTRSGNIKSTNIYKNSPIKLSLLNDSLPVAITESIDLMLRYVDETKFEIKFFDDLNYVTHDYGASFKLNDLNLLVVPDFDHSRGASRADRIKDKSWSDLLVVIKPINDVTKSLKSKLNISKTDKRGSVLEITLVDPVKEKAEDILNNLVSVFNEDAIKDKNQVAQNTAQFIDERLADIQKDLDSLERGIQTFKTTEKLTDLVAESALNLQASAGITRELIESKTQLEIARLIKNKLDKEEYDFIPENIGLQNLNIQQASSSYNSLVQEYKRYKDNATADNPILIRLKDEIDSLKSAILLSLNNTINSIEIQKQSLTRELGSVSGKISNVPENERIARYIARDREVVEAIYLLLNEKKETTAISLAVTAPKAKIVDFALASKDPVSPKPKIIYLAMLLIGFILPGAIIYTRSIFYNKIESRNDVERGLPNTNILGEVPKLDKDTLDYIIPNDRSILAESFRIIRTNLQYKLNAINNDGTKIILVTSTIKGEGKTLVSYNVSNTFAYTGKKVLLIGGDIRNPQLHRYLPNVSKRTKGVTEYLTNNQLTVKELAMTSKVNSNLDIILSGAIPPNPAELWMQDRTKELFEEAKSLYDLVIIDSAPTILVTDTLLINKYADVTTYVTRANYTDTSLLEFVADTIEDGKLSNVAVVVNNVKLANFGYGNKYGYAYGEEKKTWWDLIKKKFSKGKSFE